MARKQHEISFEEKVEILRDYQNREIKVHDIPKKYNISQHTMQSIVLELGGDFREPKKSGQRNLKGFKICPKCFRKVEIKGARFCPYCATDLRNGNEILAEKVERLKYLSSVIPETERDFFMQTLCEVNAVLLKGDK